MSWGEILKALNTNVKKPLNKLIEETCKDYPVLCYEASTAATSATLFEITGRGRILSMVITDAVYRDKTGTITIEIDGEIVIKSTLTCNYNTTAGANANTVHTIGLLPKSFGQIPFKNWSFSADSCNSVNGGTIQRLDDSETEITYSSGAAAHTRYKLINEYLEFNNSVRVSVTNPNTNEKKIGVNYQLL